MGGLDKAKYSYGVHKCFEQPVISEMVVLLAMFLYYQNMKPILTKHAPPLHDVFRQSAITKMTVGSLGSFHGFSEQGV